MLLSLMLLFHGGLLQCPARHSSERDQVEGFLNRAVFGGQSSVGILEEMVEARIEIDFDVGISSCL